MLKESLESFVPPVYGKTKRSPTTYKTIMEHCTKHITRLVSEYHGVENNQQLLRELRNDIDYYLRRYHKYCIEQREGVGAHYFEVGASETDFEHLIPASRIRDLLLQNKISVSQALNAPTVRLCKVKHRLLNEAGWGDKTPDMYSPFKRYSQVFDGKYQTYDGTEIDPATWTLENHYNYFNHLTI